jgi:hypothetical protein
VTGPQPKVTDSLSEPEPVSAAAAPPDVSGALARLGFWAAVAAVTLTVVTAVVGVTTPPRSGPMCQLEVCVAYPYTDVADFVPRDYLWLYPALALAVAVVVLLAVVAVAAPAGLRGHAAAGLALAVLGATALVLDYGVQLFVVQPSLLAGENQSLSLISQYNPHGVFIALENIGYAALALAFVLLGVAMPGGGPVRVARWAFIVGGALTWAALVALAAFYRAGLEYRFELASISLHWLIVVVGGVALAVHFGRARRPAGMSA